MYISFISPYYHQFNFKLFSESSVMYAWAALVVRAGIYANGEKESHFYSDQWFSILHLDNYALLPSVLMSSTNVSKLFKILFYAEFDIDILGEKFRWHWKNSASLYYSWHSDSNSRLLAKYLCRNIKIVSRLQFWSYI